VLWLISRRSAWSFSPLPLSLLGQLGFLYPDLHPFFTKWMTVLFKNLHWWEEVTFCLKLVLKTVSPWHFCVVLLISIANNHYVQSTSYMQHSIRTDYKDLDMRGLMSYFDKLRITIYIQLSSSMSSFGYVRIFCTGDRSQAIEL
jgi:hypothetical protein